MTFFEPIEHRHILEAIIELLVGNDHGFGEPDRYYIEHRGFHYPAKAVIGIARTIATGEETPWYWFHSGPKRLGPVCRKLGLRLVNSDEVEVRLPPSLAPIV